MPHFCPQLLKLLYGSVLIGCILKMFYILLNSRADFGFNALKCTVCFSASVQLVFLHCDRYVEFHSQHGHYYKTRIPKFGRDFSYHYPSCDLFFVGTRWEHDWMIDVEVFCLSGMFFTLLLDSHRHLLCNKTCCFMYWWDSKNTFWEVQPGQCINVVKGF